MNQTEPMYCLYEKETVFRLPRKVYIEPTSMCNLNCSICFRHGWINEQIGHIASDRFDRLAAQLSHMDSVEEIFFGGMGEPLFHPEICRMIAGLPRSKKISLLTNATMLTPEMSQSLIQAGLAELWISMDGFEKQVYEKIQLGSRFDRIISNIESFNIARAGTAVRLCITFVVTPENADQLQCINEFADRFCVDELNISHMIPGEPIRKEETLYDRPDIPVGKLHRFTPQAFPVKEHVCPFISNDAVFVRWDGSVAPCMQLLHSCYTYLFEEKRKITSFSYGNISDSTLIDCWCRPDYSEFRERVQTFYFPFCTICWGCEDRKQNLTDCIYGEAPTCGACLWATGKVFCP